MARLIDRPAGLPENFREPLSGPRIIGSGVTESIGGFTQTVSSPFGAWRWRFQFANMRGQIARRYRGWITALHGGANATRVPFCDWDGLSFEQMGVQTTHRDWRQGQPWSNGEPWSNGKNWGSTPPQVPVAQASPLGGTEIYLADAFWGHGLGMGDLIGFFPFHLGMYEITQVFEPGHYRVWPPLRKALTTDDEATLRPTLAMRLENEDAATAPRDAFAITNASVTLVEVFDYDVREYFNDETPYAIQPPQPAPVPTITATGNFVSKAYMRDGKAVSASEAWTLERASIATYTDPSGILQAASADEPRFDYDPVTGVALGLLVEGEATNLFLWSEAFDNAAWKKQQGASVTADQAAAPDGAQTADELTFDTFRTSAAWQGAIAGTIGTFSISTWAGTADQRFQFICYNAADGSLYGTDWDLSAEMRRYSDVFTTSSAGQWYIANADDATARTINAWGAQLEAGGEATSYIKTEGAPATRAADTLTLVADGTNDWTLTFDDGSEQSISGVSGNLVLTRADIDRPHIKAYRAERA